MKPTLIALAILVLALSLRVMNARSAIVDGVPQLTPLDDLYHLKRITFSAKAFPSVLERDPYRGVEGNPLWCPWPPLYDLGAGGLMRLLGARYESDVLVRVVWLPPILFAIFASLASILVARARGNIAGALTGIALACSPFLVEFSWIGSIDHHYLEPPLAFVVAWFVLHILRRDEVDTAVMLGLAMAAALFVQTALLVMCGLAFLVLFAARREAATAFLLVAVVIVLYRLTRPAGYPDSEWFLGWPHAALFAGAALALILRNRGAPILLALAAAAALVLAVPNAADALIGGSHFFGGDPWLRTISEFMPVIGEHPDDLIADIVLLSGGVILVWPFALCAWRRRDPWDGAIACFAIAYLLLDLSSRRFRPLAIGFLALAASLYAGRLHQEGRRTFATIAFLLVALPPPIQLAAWTIGEPMAQSAAWLRAADFFHRQTPGGRVLAPWGMGHFLDVVAERPVVTDNFGSMPDRVTFERAHDAYLTTHEETLARYCAASGIRWVIFDNAIYDIPEAAAVLGIDSTRFVTLAPGGEPARITRLAQATTWWRAYYDRGAPRPHQGMFGRPLKRFHLVYVDPQSSWRGTPVLNGPALEIWERTK